MIKRMGKNNIVRFGIWATVLVLSASTAARADTLFSNLGFQPGIGYTVSTQSSQVNADFSQGDAFSVSETAQLSAIDVAIGLVSGSNEIIVKLMTDNTGQPGAVLETWDAVNQMSTFGSTTLVALNSVLNPVLTAGQQYWLVAFAQDSTWAAWNWNATNDSGPHALSTDNGATYSVSTQTRGAFEVDGTVAAPEPSGLALVIVGLAGLALVTRERKASGGTA